MQDDKPLPATPDSSFPSSLAVTDLPPSWPSEESSSPLTVDDQNNALDAPASTADEEGESDSTMGNLLQESEEQYRAPRRGDIIEGAIMSVSREAIMVDIGMKSEGMVPSQEIQQLDAHIFENLKVGDKIFIFVVQPESREGHAVLSLSRAKAERGWAVAQKYFDDNITFEADVVDYNRGGLIVDIDSVRGFVPLSQVVGVRHDVAAEQGTDSRLASLVGQSVPVKVLEINRRRNRLILSERLGSQERRAQRKDQLIEELQEGETRRGRVSSVCDFGAFIDVGGADGLVHLSELSWGPIQHPSNIVKVGDEVDVVVLGIDKEKKKISLSLRRGQPEPWAKVPDRYPPGSVVEATITKLATFGAFARLENGVEGLIHISELSDAHVAHPRNVIKEGDVVNVRVLRIDSERRRIGLSLRQAPQEERTEEPPAENDPSLDQRWPDITVDESDDNQ